jgi:hypothetical protein
VSLMTSRPASFSMALIHLLARPWGSMHNGHRRPAHHVRDIMLSYGCQNTGQQGLIADSSSASTALQCWQLPAACE